MHRRKRPLGKLPTRWLFTDERAHGPAGERLWPVLARLPRGCGVVFRHYGLPRRQRIALARRVAARVRARGCVLLIAGPRLPVTADGAHRPRWMPCTGPSHQGLVSRSVHDATEAARARRERADLAFVSPVRPTASHPGAATLGRHGFARLARLAGCAAIALGGMDAAAARRLPAHGFAWVSS